MAVRISSPTSGVAKANPEIIAPRPNQEFHFKTREDGENRPCNIENALVLAVTRRLMRPADAPPLGTIRSLAYFLPVIEEVLGLRVSPEYFAYLRYKLARAGFTR